MSGIKIKIGKCIDCRPDSEDKPLIKERCQSHYWKYRNSLSSKKTKQVEKKVERQNLSVFFANEIKEIPANCEECGCKLILTQSWMKRAAIAHILPKRHFHSISMHPKNKVYLCIDCHTDFDNRGSQHVIKMKLFDKMKQVVQDTLLPLIPESEMRYLPEYFS